MFLLRKGKAYQFLQNALRKPSLRFFSKPMDSLEDLPAYNFLINSVNENASPESMLDWFESLSLSERLLVLSESNHKSLGSGQILREWPSMSLISSGLTLSELIDECEPQIDSFGLRELQNFTSIQFFSDSARDFSDIISRVNQLQSQIHSNGDLRHFLDVVLTIAAKDKATRTSDIVRDDDLAQLELRSREWRDINNESRFLQCYFFKDFGLNASPQIEILARLQTDLTQLEPVNYLMIVLVLVEVANSGFLRLSETTDPSDEALTQYLDTDPNAQFLRRFLELKYDAENSSLDQLNLCGPFASNMKMIRDYPLYAMLPELEQAFYTILLHKFRLSMDGLQVWEDVLGLVRVCPSLTTQNATLFFDFLLIKTLFCTLKMQAYNPVLANQQIESFPEEFIQNSKEIVSKLELNISLDFDQLPNEVQSDVFDLTILSELVFKDFFLILSMFAMTVHVRKSPDHDSIFNVIYIKLKELMLTHLAIYEMLVAKLTSLDEQEQEERLTNQFRADSPELQISLEMLQNLEQWRMISLHNLEHFGSMDLAFVCDVLRGDDEGGEIADALVNLVGLVDRR